MRFAEHTPNSAMRRTQFAMTSSFQACARPEHRIKRRLKDAAIARPHQCNSLLWSPAWGMAALRCPQGKVSIRRFHVVPSSLSSKLMKGSMSAPATNPLPLVRRNGLAGAAARVAIVEHHVRLVSQALPRLPRAVEPARHVRPRRLPGLLRRLHRVRRSPVRGQGPVQPHANPSRRKLEVRPNQTGSETFASNTHIMHSIQEVRCGSRYHTTIGAPPSSRADRLTSGREHELNRAKCSRIPHLCRSYRRAYSHGSGEPWALRTC
jgi:hypothetical protein